MNIMMIMSQERIDQEHAMLNRIVVGFANDGHQVIRVVPLTPDDEPSEHEKAVSLAKRITTPMPVSWLLRKTRREEILSIIEKIKIDSIIAFGDDACTLALDLEPYLNAPVYKEVLSMREAKRARRSSKITTWLAATPSIARAIATKVGESRVAVVPLAAAPSQQDQKNPPSKNRCITILDGASNPKATKQILEALRQLQDIHVFIELTGKNHHKVWKMIDQLGMLDRVTCLRDIATVRTLIIESDVVLLPSATMPMRTVLLEVMLASIPIIATSIDGYDMLIDNETAIITDDSWKESINNVLNEPQNGASFAKNGAHLISKQYASAVQIAAFEAAFSLN